MGAAAGAISVVGGIAQSVMGAKQAKKAQKAIDSYRRQELRNAYEDLSVSTLSADLQRDALAKSTSTSVAALRSGGVRGLAAGVGRIQEQNVAASRQIGADLDRQQKEIDRAVAQDEVRIQKMQERREEADLAGLGQQLATGQQNVAGGISNVIGAMGNFAGAGLAGAAGPAAGAAGASTQVAAPSVPGVDLNSVFKVTNPVFTQPPTYDNLYN